MSNVLTFSDLHEPFSITGYLKFLKRIYKKHKCNKVVVPGDVIDFHAVSFHQSEPDALGSEQEFEQAIKNLKAVYKAFPEADYIPGNHCKRVHRVAANAGISSIFIKDLHTLLEMPDGWKIHTDKYICDDVLYIHGEGYSGMNGHRNAAIDNRMSTVIGHLHSHAGISNMANDDSLIWGMNIGCGIDAAAYAMRYGKCFRNKPIVSCGVVINGKPYLETMDLGTKIKRIKC